MRRSKRRGHKEKAKQAGKGDEAGNQRSIKSEGGYVDEGIKGKNEVKANSQSALGP